MTGPRHQDAVRRSAVAWLTRLGWNYLPREHMQRLDGARENPILPDRLLPMLRRHRIVHEGRLLPLDPTAIDAIIRTTERTHPGAGWAAASAEMHRLLRDGVTVDQVLDEGTRVTATVPLIDWDHPNRNHWDVADDVRGSGASRAAGIRDLVCFVNGLPLVLLACVERDAHGTWGRATDGIAHLLRGLQASVMEPPYRQAQLLIALDRCGARYAGVGTPTHGWMRWREQGWDRTRREQLRACPARLHGGPPDVPLGVHAETLRGLMAPARLLQLLRAFMWTAPHAPLKIARSAQYFAVQASLDHLRSVAAKRRRNDAQVWISSGCGLQRVREWLLLAKQRDPALRKLRMLMPVSRPARPTPRWLHPYDPRDDATDPVLLVDVLEGAAPSPLEVPLDVLLHWATSMPAAPSRTADVVLLLDGEFWSQPDDALLALRERLPQASWLTLAAAPVACGTAGLTPGPVLYGYGAREAIADNVVVPTCEVAPTLDPTPTPPGSVDGALRRTGIARFIVRHLQQSVVQTERNLRAALLVATPAHATDYRQAIEAHGGCHTWARVFDATGHATDGSTVIPPGFVALDISSGSLPAAQESRLGIVYVDRPLSAIERQRLVGLLNQADSDKQVALWVDLGHHQDVAPGTVPAASARHLPRVPDTTRLQALLPALPADDFHACLRRLSPQWSLNDFGVDRDMHRRRRRLHHERVARFGQALQLAVSTSGRVQGATEDATLAQQRIALQHHSLLREAAADDAGERHLYSREDIRLRHWAREATPEVRDHPLDDAAAEADLTPAESLLRQVNQLHTGLRARMEDPAAEPPFQEEARRALQKVLADHPEPASRLAALEDLRSRLPRILHGGREATFSRGYLLLESHLDVTTDPGRYAEVAERIDAVVRDGRCHLPDQPRRFRQHVRASLLPLLEAELGDVMSLRVLESVLTRAPHWPSPD